MPSINDINVLSILSPTVINDPAIYGVVVSKILIARDKEMNLSLDVNVTDQLGVINGSLLYLEKDNQDSEDNFVRALTELL